MTRALRATTVAALLLASPAAAGIDGGPHDLKVGQTIVFTVVVTPDSGGAIEQVTTVVPAAATLLGETADPGWRWTRTAARTVAWQPIQPATRVTHFRLRLRLGEPGDTAVVVRTRYTNGASEQAPLALFVTGSTAGMDGALTLALVVGAFLFLLAMGLVVAGARRLR
jgi:hypothetical protein